MIDKFTPAAEKALEAAHRYAMELGHTYIGTEHLLLGILETESPAAGLLSSRGVTFSETKRLIVEAEGIGYCKKVSAEDISPRLHSVIEGASYAARKSGASLIGSEQLLFSILCEGDCCAVRLIRGQNASTVELYAELVGIKAGIDSHALGEYPFSAQKTKSLPSELLSYGYDMTERAIRGELDPLIGREAEMNSLLCVLCRRSKNNPCLIGDPGVGKTALVEGLATKIACGDVPPLLTGKRLVSLDLPAMLSGAKYRGEFEERIKAVINAVKGRDDVILFIDELHTIVGAGASEGSIDASNIVKPALARGELRLIGATTIQEYRKTVEKDGALDRRFQAIMLREPSREEATKMLFGVREKYERHHGLKISDEAIKAAVWLSEKYIPMKFLPDKALDLIDEAASSKRISKISERAQNTSAPNTAARDEAPQFASETTDNMLAKNVADGNFKDASAILKTAGQKIVYDKAHGVFDGKGYIGSFTDYGEHTNLYDSVLTVNENDITMALEAKTGINLRGAPSLADALKARLRSVMFGQDSAVEEVCLAIRRGLSGLSEENKPLASVLLIGPSGVGKTLLATETGNAVFGDDSRALVKFNLSEYTEPHSISKLIGSPPGYVGHGEEGLLTSAVRQRPRCTILLDEADKASREVLLLFLQILDCGFLTDSCGVKVDFRQTLFIMTACSEHRQGRLGFGSDEQSYEGASYDSRLMNIFPSELLSRLDAVISLTPLTLAATEKIAEKELLSLCSRLKKLGYSARVESGTALHIAKKSFSREHGARALKRFIRSSVEDKIIEALPHTKDGDELIIFANSEEISLKTVTKQPFLHIM